MKLTFDDRVERKSNLQTINDPIWDDVEAAIRRLNGRNHTEVFLEDGANMSVSGGEVGYFLSIFTEDERTKVLIDEMKSSVEIVHLVSGGQRVALPSQRIVDLQKALQAAQRFFQRQEADETMQWVEN